MTRHGTRSHPGSAPGASAGGPSGPHTTPGPRARPRAGRGAGRRHGAATPGRAADTSVRELEIESIAAGGDGVARAEGLVVFTPRTAPGDRARVAITTTPGGRFGRGALVEIVRQSPARTIPRCVHFTKDRCGGCQLQHLEYDAQLDAKRAIVRDSLVRIGRQSVASVPITASPSVWRYRRKLTLTLRQVGPQRWIGGLHRFDAPDEIFALDDCPITDESVVAVWGAVMRAAHLLPDAPELRGAIRVTTDGFALVVEGGHRWPSSAQFAAAVPALTEIWWAADDAARRPLPTARRPSSGSEAPIAAAPGAPPPIGASFVQVNAALSERLQADAVERALAYRPATAVDAYAGTGTTALALARAGVRVTAIEIDAAAAAHCAAGLPAGSRCLAAATEDVLGQALPADVVLLNPPRSGVDSRVTTLLRTAEPPPRAVIYVSCDPATLARDVAQLAGWRIVHIQAYDMFPQTAHVETLCELVPPGAAVAA